MEISTAAHNMEKEKLDRLRETVENASLATYHETIAFLREYRMDAILKRYISQLARNLSLDAFDIVKDIETEKPKRDRKPRLISFKELLKEPEEETSFIVDPMLPVQSILALIGRRGNYKSILAGECARGIVTGTPVLGWPTTKQKVVIVDMENRPRLTKKRMIELGVPANADLHFLFRRDIKFLDIEEDHALIMELCQDSVVIIDTLSKIHSRDENSNAEMTAVMSVLLDMIESKRIKAIIVIHHLGKDTEKGGRGASAIEDNPDIVMELIKTDSKSEGRLKCTKHREEANELLKKDIRFDFSIEGKIRVIDIGNEVIYRFLVAVHNLPDGSMDSQSATLEALAATGWAREGAKDLLKQCVAQGYMTMEKDRKNNNSMRYSLKLETMKRIAAGEFREF